MKKIFATISVFGVALSNNVIQPGNHYDPAAQTCAGTSFVTGESGLCLHQELSSACDTNLQCPTDCCSDIQGILPRSFCLPQAYCSKKAAESACSHDFECSSLTCSQGTCTSATPRVESISKHKLKAST